MQIALYSRVSSDRQDTDLSISAQMRAMRDYSTRNGHEVVREFVDEAESGRNTARPAFREMIALAKTKSPPFEGILVWKLNRFARSRADSITYKTLLRNKGIEVLSVNEPLDDTPTGRLLEGVIESIDEFYSDNLAEDIKRGMRENALRGFFNGSRPPYGFRKIKVTDGNRERNRLEPEPDHSVAVRTVRRMFDMVKKDIGCKEIAKTLNQEGFRTAKGQRWGRTTVYKVLSNEAYAGTLIWGRRRGHSAIHNGEPPVRLENAWPAIIDRGTFDLVQRKMATKRPKVAHPRTIPSFYLFSGVMFCTCGAAMTGHSAKSGNYFYYQCSRKSRQGNDACDARMLPKDRIERSVIDQIKSRVLIDDNLEALVLMVNEELKSTSQLLKEKLDVVDAELKDVKARLSRLYDALETGKLTLDDLAPRIRELKGTQDDLNHTRLQLEVDMVAESTGEIDVSIVKSYASDLYSLLEESDLAERKAFLRSFVKRIVVDDEEATIYYKLPLPPGCGAKDRVSVLPIDTFGGAGGIRTPYLLTASQTLSQLSYSPIFCLPE
jgi:site-specific DNA recombinase